MKKLILLIFTIIMAACSKSKDEDSIKGLDLSGTWRTTGVECYDSSLENLTAKGIISSGSPVGTLNIKGNQLTSEGTNGSCKVSYVRKVIANLKSGSATNGYGTGMLGATTVNINTGSSCTGVTTFTMSLGSITPSTLSSTFSQNQSIAEQSFEFLINEPYLLLTSLIQVVGSTTDICFIVQEKL